MFCPACGTKNENDAAFCAACGARMAENRNTANPSGPVDGKEDNAAQGLASPQAARERPVVRRARRRPLAKGAKNAIAIVMALAVVLGGAYAAGLWLTSPGHVESAYQSAMDKNDWAAMFQYLDVERTAFIHEAAFANYMRSGGAPGTATLNEGDGKRLLFFDDYRISVDNMTVRNYKINAPKGSTVYLDGVLLENADTGHGGSDIYTIAALFLGPHTISIDFFPYETYENQFGIDTASAAEFVSGGFVLKASDQSELAQRTRDTFDHMLASAVAGAAYDSAVLPEAVRRPYERLVRDLTAEGGNGPKSVDITNVSDDSQNSNAAGAYMCSLRVDFDYTPASPASGGLGAISSQGSADIHFTYAYADGGWTLEKASIDELAFIAGRENAPESGAGAKPAIPAKQEPYDQKIEITATSGSYANLIVYEWQNNAWEALYSTTARIGSNGVGEAFGEGKKTTPKGTFNILFCFGLTQPETGLAFRKVNADSVFVDDPASPYYNTLISSSRIAASVSREETYKFFSAGTYSTSIFFDFNGDGETSGQAVPYKGSVYTICGCNISLKATLGCIDITSEDMAHILGYLDSDKHPVVIIS